MQDMKIENNTWYMKKNIVEKKDFGKDIRGSHIADGLTDDELFLISTTASERRFIKGTLIIEEKTLDRDIFVLCEGRVRIELRLPTGCAGGFRQVFNIRHGQVFGEVSYLDGIARSASVRAWGNVRVLILNADKLDALLKNHPELGYKFMRNLGRLVCRRLRNSNDQWRSAMTDGLLLEELNYY